MHLQMRKRVHTKDSAATGKGWREAGTRCSLFPYCSQLCKFLILLSHLPRILFDALDQVEAYSVAIWKVCGASLSVWAWVLT